MKVRVVILFISEGYGVERGANLALEVPVERIGASGTMLQGGRIWFKAGHLVFSAI